MITTWITTRMTTRITTGPLHCTQQIKDSTCTTLYETVPHCKTTNYTSQRTDAACPPTANKQLLTLIQPSTVIQISLCILI